MLLEVERVTSVATGIALGFGTLDRLCLFSFACERVGSLHATGHGLVEMFMMWAFRVCYTCKSAVTCLVQRRWFLDRVLRVDLFFRRVKYFLYLLCVYSFPTRWVAPITTVHVL